MIFMNNKEYVLMHKNIPVLTVTLTENNRVRHIDEILNEEHLPINMKSDENKLITLSEFMKYRAIPRVRQNLSSLLTAYKANDALDLSIKSYQLSISDHYWIKPIATDLSWKEVNFFENDFNDAYIFIAEDVTDNINICTPNTSVNGTLNQMWIQENTDLILLKAGGVLTLEPFNEVFISKLLHETTINHVDYELRQIKNDIYVSACKAFTNNEYEFIPAWQIMSNIRFNENKYQVLLEQCQKYNMPNIQKDIDSMIALDYLILNDDRHWGNFGFLRHSDTLTFTGLAPIFDNGNSLWYDQYKINVNKPYYAYDSQPFNSKHEKQINNIETDLSEMNIKNIIKIMPELMENIYIKNEFITSERLNIMKTLFIDRAKILENHIEYTKNNRKELDISYSKGLSL